MKPPEKVKVGPYDISVKPLDKSEEKDNYGTFSSTDLEIRLKEDFKTPHIAADTFLHELLHAVWFVHGIRAKDGEERIVNTLSTGLAQVIRDNPKAFDWIRANLK
jgi:hypothetical protein